jgi:hypothetical protein
MGTWHLRALRIFEKDKPFELLSQVKSGMGDEIP